jgi:hypothetical protein
MRQFLMHKAWKVLNEKLSDILLLLSLFSINPEEYFKVCGLLILTYLLEPLLILIIIGVISGGLDVQTVEIDQH